MCRQPNGGNHEETVWPAGRGTAGAGADPGFAAAQSKITVAVGGGACLCYLPTVLAKQLGEFDKAGLNVELVDSRAARTRSRPCSAAAPTWCPAISTIASIWPPRSRNWCRSWSMTAIPAWCWSCRPRTAEIKSIKDLAGKKVGVSAPGSSTDFFLKFLLKKNGLDPTSAAVIGVGLGATAVAAMEQGQIDAAVMLDPSVTVLQGSHPTEDPRRYPHAKGYAGAVRRRISGRRAVFDRGLDRLARKGSAGPDHRHRQHAELDSLAFG